MATTNPDLAQEWNYDKNIDLTPCDVTAGSRKKVWWRCEKGHAYEQFIIKRTNRGYSCPYCSGHKALRGFNDLATVNPRLAKEWHPTKNADLTPFDVTAGSGKRVWWMCPVGHEYQATIHDRNSDDTQCPICNAKNQTSFPEQAILYYVKKLYPDAVNRYKEIFEHSIELDVYIPSIRLGIEFDGAAWHNSATQLKREKKKYTICQKHHITLIRVKENTDQEWNDVADAVYYIPKVRTYSELEGVIQAILDSIDRNSNMWTRKNPRYLHSAITVDLERDRADILNYLNEIKNSLEELRPDVVRCWDFTKNKNLVPSMFTVSSNQVVWWKCPDCGHEWQCSINSMTRPGRYGCAECSKSRRGTTYTKQVAKRVGSLAETMPDLAKEWHPTKNGVLSPDDISAGHFKTVWWLCPQCGYEWEASPNNRKRGVGCPCCSGRVPKSGVNDLATLCPGLMEEWNFQKNVGLNPRQLLPGSGKRAWWKCPRCGHEWEAVIASRTKGHGCPKCAKQKKRPKSETKGLV
ncbi:zinc-ribbon domain-containing protein [Flintibacter sp. P01028]|uniref:zinc-ribbon domain-containing protein n=1 Tax=Flintibacter sp. P01028 TaxID=3342382 RepID=UPI0035B614B2